MPPTVRIKARSITVELSEIWRLFIMNWSPARKIANRINYNLTLKGRQGSHRFFSLERSLRMMLQQPLAIGRTISFSISTWPLDLVSCGCEDHLATWIGLNPHCPGR